MKQIKFLTYLLFLIVLLGSCKKDFLTLYPEGNLNEGNFYKSTQDFQQAVAGAYTPLRDIANNAYWMDEMRSDNAHYDYNQSDRGNALTENLVDFIDQSNNGITQNRYQAAFNGVSRTNIILDRLAAIEFTMADADKNQIMGEAKALRGHYYFDLVRNYGGVPLHLHEVKTPTEAFLERASAEQVYTQVISDLTDAINLLAAPTFAAAQTGRITKGSVATELAMVYMQRKEYDKAIPLLRSVTQMGYALMPNFRDVLNPANKNGNKEIIWDVQFQSGTTQQQSNFIYRFTPVTTNTMNILGVSFSNSIGGWNVPTESLINTFEPGDSRFDASIGVIEGTLDASSKFVPTRVVSAVGYTQPAGVVAKYFARKYYYPPYPNLNQNTDQNWPLYRYSDVLLLLAEALNETNKSAEALPYLNQVRTRAFGAGNGQITTTDPAALRTIIADERRRELAFENKRWQDLIRTGQAIQVMTAYGAAIKQKFPYLLPQTYNVTQDRLLYPIPLREIQLNTKLVQNPGY
ncbi:MAG: RagB/SusD family nutrient uptake outer membrane protein [Bacteroidota bacterium]|nr:RagB/SusD family nutrient uptake outer membrane protein [Bacteroidota bacterium]